MPRTDPETGEVHDPTTCEFQARFKGPGAIKCDKEGQASFDVTFVVSGKRKDIDDLMLPFVELMAATAASDKLTVVVQPVHRLGPPLG